MLNIFGEVGIKVSKKSRKPFKSGNKINTVSGYILNPRTGKDALMFDEDDSIVDLQQCIVEPLVAPYK